MTYYGGKELATAFRTVRGNTIQIAEEIPEDKYGFRASPDTRTIAMTLAHIAAIPLIQLNIHQNRIDDLMKVDFPSLSRAMRDEESKPLTKAELLALLRREGDSFAAWLETLPEAFLAETVKMPPNGPVATKTRLEMLLAPKEHEMHHRGQLMLLQRMTGGKPHLTRQMEERAAQMAQARK